MNLSNLRVNQLSSEAWSWYQKYLLAIDKQDVAADAALLAPEATLQFNNDAPIAGRDAIAGMLTGYDGKPVTVRAVAFTDRGPQGLVLSARIYADVSRLFAN